MIIAQPCVPAQGTPADPPCASSGFDGPKVQAAPDPDPRFVPLLERKEEFRERLLRMLHFSEALKMQATALINKYLSGREALIVTSRFLSGLSWPKIAKKLENPLCDKQLRRICRAALEKIILPENVLWLHRHSNAP